MAAGCTPRGPNRRPWPTEAAPIDGCSSLAAGCCCRLAAADGSGHSQQLSTDSLHSRFEPTGTQTVEREGLPQGHEGDAASYFNTVDIYVGNMYGKVP